MFTSRSLNLVERIYFTSGEQVLRYFIFPEQPKESKEDSWPNNLPIQFLILLPEVSWRLKS